MCIFYNQIIRIMIFSTTSIISTLGTGEQANFLLLKVLIIKKICPEGI